MQCPIAASLDLLGDRWTLVVVGDLLLGHRYAFSEIGVDEGIATNVLQNRLDRLSEAGSSNVVATPPTTADGSTCPPTARSTCCPMLVDLVVWGDTHTEAKSQHKIALAVRRDRAGVLQALEEGVRKTSRRPPDNPQRHFGTPGHDSC